MKRFQNIDTFEILVTNTGGNFYFPIDRPFVGKKIKRIQVLFSTFQQFSPLGIKLLPFDSSAFVYLNLFEFGKSSPFYKNLSFSVNSITSNQDFLINRVVDFQASNISIKPNTKMTAGDTYSMLIAIEYQTKNYDVMLEATNVKTIFIEPVEGKYKYDLKDYITNASLGEKKVTRIVCEGNIQGYLTLRTKGENTFNNVPLCFLLRDINTEHNYFDNLSVDFENSNINMSATGGVQLSFYYE